MKSRGLVLVAEDEAQARRALCALLEEEGYRVLSVADGREAARLLEREPVDAALVDIRMPGMDGLALLEQLRDQRDAPPVLIMTAYGSSEIAIRAMALGAFDYLTKPIHFEELRIQLERAIESRRRAAELEVYRAEEKAARETEMIGQSPAMQRLYKLIGQVAPTDSTVLITGESGTGKELIAEAIHRHSPRAGQRLVKVNCAAIPETLLEAEMFGYERGAFTGAFERRIGKFEFASGGTIFLDEIGDLAPSTQAKLLRVLQEHAIERLGSNATIPVDVRVVAATNRDLADAVRQGHFREDLYYRLSVVVLRAPALRAAARGHPGVGALPAAAHGGSSETGAAGDFRRSYGVAQGAGLAGKRPGAGTLSGAGSGAEPRGSHHARSPWRRGLRGDHGSVRRRAVGRGPACRGRAAPEADDRARAGAGRRQPESRGRAAEDPSPPALRQDETIRPARAVRGSREGGLKGVELYMAGTQRTGSSSSSSQAEEASRSSSSRICPQSRQRR